MMSPLCLLAIVLCLPLGCLGARTDCTEQIDNIGGPPRSDINNYKAFKYESIVEGVCDSAALTCEATIEPASILHGRTWFISNIRPNFGLFYEEQIIQQFNVRCPANTYLHLYVQNSSLPNPPLGGECESVDNVLVEAEGLITRFCGSNDYVQSNSELYNLGRGRIFPDGHANISFCSDNDAQDGQFNGFVMRASCLDPSKFLLPGCVDLSFFRAWDPDFVNQIFNMLAEVEKITLPHKKRRSVSEALAMKRMQRKKRFTGRLDLLGGDVVTYNNRELTITNNATGDVTTLENIGSINAYNSLIGTRSFIESAPFAFSGPGILLYDRSFAKLTSYTIPDDMVESIFLPGRLETDVANIIYEYIYNNWIFPYPVIDNTERRTTPLPIFPLPPGNSPPEFPDLDIDGYRSTVDLGFIQEVIQSGDDTGDCKRAIRIEVAPSNKARMAPEIVRFCQFFDKSCDLGLRTACREALRLDPRSVGK